MPLSAYETTESILGDITLGRGCVVSEFVALHTLYEGQVFAHSDKFDLLAKHADTFP
jgi:hypothetical protein